MFDYAGVATLVAVVSAAVVGGVFFTFSSFVMPALVRLPPADGIRAMQSINVTAVRPPLMAVLFGTGLLAITLVITRWGQPWILTGASLYLVGVIGVTAAGNVPRNNALAKLNADAVAAQDAWRRYVTGWGRWNHVRGIAGIASAAAFLAAALV